MLLIIGGLILEFFKLPDIVITCILCLFALFCLLSFPLPLVFHIGLICA